MKKHLLLFAMLITGFAMNAQSRCGYEAIKAKSMANDPQFRKEVEQLKKDWSDYIQNKSQYANRTYMVGTDTIYEIPVVVHVIHSGQPVGSDFNRTDAQIQAWLDYTNAIFEGTAPGFLTTGTGGANIPIRLVLAKRDPSCNTTSGIIRIDGSTIPGYAAHGVNSDSTNGAPENALKTASRWDGNNYYNIYIVTKIDSYDGFVGGGTDGYATFPTSNAYNYNTVILSSVVNTSSYVMAHEFGHSMGLDHPFTTSTGDTDCPAAETDCTTEGDMVCDTEIIPQVFTCPDATDINPCTGAVYNGTQFNVMAYATCPDRFTPGQRERAVFMFVSNKQSLLLSLGSVAPDASPAVTPVATTCVPTASTAGSDDIGPAFVGFNDIAVPSQGYLGDGNRFYIDYTQEVCQYFVSHTTVESGMTYPLKFKLIDINDEYVRAYIDYDNSGTFEASEEIYNSGTKLAPGSYSENITIPATALRNTPLRLRVIADFDDITSACSDRDYGQTEDFAVTVLDPLSKNIVSFEVKNNNCQNLISWEMSDVSGVQFFTIEMSMDGQHFEKVKTVNTISNQNIYAISDLNKENGVMIYRLVVNLKNGQQIYSQLAKVDAHCNNGFNVYPNPADQVVSVKYLSNNSSTATINIIDVMGKVVLQQSYNVAVGDNVWNVDLKNISAGAYILKVEAGTAAHQQVIIKK